MGYYEIDKINSIIFIYKKSHKGLIGYLRVKE